MRQTGLVICSWHPQYFGPAAPGKVFAFMRNSAKQRLRQIIRPDIATARRRSVSDGVCKACALEMYRQNVELTRAACFNA